MKALVGYDSQFGNTEKIARAIVEGIGGTGEAELERARAWGKRIFLTVYGCVSNVSGS